MKSKVHKLLLTLCLLVYSISLAFNFSIISCIFYQSIFINSKLLYKIAVVSKYCLVTLNLKYSYRSLLIIINGKSFDLSIDVIAKPFLSVVIVTVSELDIKFTLILLTGLLLHFNQTANGVSFSF